MFGRRTTASGSTEAGELAAQKLGGKGRPTPTRKEAEAARKQRLAAPRSRKESAARQREVTRQGRLKIRQAMASGDERYLPARDQGAAKRYARDYVDSRRTIGEFLLPTFFIIFVLAILLHDYGNQIGNYLWFAVIAAMATDAVRVVRGVKAGLRERLGDDKAKGVAVYAVMRALQMRRLRLPKPLVSVGDSI
ncbi:MAG: DUF3043 domain-containing protein [Nocardioidaceae bacterium]